VSPEKQDAVAQLVIEAATKTGGSGSKDLPSDKGVKVLVLVPASAEAQFRQTLVALGAPSPASSATPRATSPNEPINFEIVFSSPRR
jgi:hypothetical protein